MDRLDRLNYASFFEVFRKGTNGLTNEKTANVLLGCIYNTVDVYRDKTEDIQKYVAISSKEVSDYKNQNTPIAKALVQAAADEKVIQKAPNYFKKHVLIHLDPDLQGDMFDSMFELIATAENIDGGTRTRLMRLAEHIDTPEQQAVYLANVFLFAVKQKNKKKVEKKAAACFKDDFDNLKLKAQTGDGDAMFSLACMHYYGIIDDNGGLESNQADAYKWMKQAVDANCHNKASALQMIGTMYYHGTVPAKEQSFEECLKYLEDAKKYTNNNGHLAYMRSVGCGCIFDYNTAEQYYLDMSIDNDTLVIANLARFYERYGHFKEAFKYYKKIYRIYPRAAIRLGKIYKYGLHKDDPKPDYKEAEICFLKAKSSPVFEAEANYELGELYYSPTGDFPKDFSTAMRYFHAAAEKDHMKANYMLGYMYYYGHCGRDLSKAILYHTKAYNLGSMLSAVDLAMIYQQPTEFQNYEEAYKYAKIAASSEIMEGEFIYANLLFLGRGCPKDVNKAVNYYKLLVKKGFDKAEYMLKLAEKYLK